VRKYLQRVGRAPPARIGSRWGQEVCNSLSMSKSVFKRCGSSPVLGNIELLSPLAAWASERGALAPAYIVWPHALETCALSIIYKALITSWIFNA